MNVKMIIVRGIAIITVSSICLVNRLIFGEEVDPSLLFLTLLKLATKEDTK